VSEWIATNFNLQSGKQELVKKTTKHTQKTKEKAQSMGKNTYCNELDVILHHRQCQRPVVCAIDNIARIQATWHIVST
jgi:hypothetical protein